MITGIMGAAGSFTEQAAMHYSKKQQWSDTQFKLLIEIRSVLQAVTTGKVDTVVFPIQNSLSGIVESSIRGMAEYEFKVTDIFEYEIDQNLLILPGTTAAQVTNITSQRPAIGQCISYLERIWSYTPIVEYVDTAKAAADLANGTLPPTSAVIASARCAEIYNLDILEGSIQDLKNNLTTFVVGKKK